MQIAAIEKGRNGSYLCTCRLFLKMRFPGIEGMASPQARGLVGLSKMADMEEPDWLRLPLELTPSGWRSSDFELAVGANSIESLLKR